MKNRILFASLLSTLAFLPQNTMATQASCSGAIACATGASAAMTINVTIPAFIRFQLGSAILDPVVNFDYSAAPATVGDGVTTTSSSSLNHGTATAGDVAVVLQSNTGGVTGVQITVTLTDGGIVTAATPNAPVWSEFSVVAAGANIPSPDPTLINGGTTNFAGTSVRNLSDTWTFTYANTKTLLANVYSGTVAYTAATY